MNPLLLDSCRYPSSHNHGSGKWVPPIWVSFHLRWFSTSMIMGGRVIWKKNNLPNKSSRQCGSWHLSACRWPWSSALWRAWGLENRPGLNMYFLLKMGIIQPAMLDYQSVPPTCNIPIYHPPTSQPKWKIWASQIDSFPTNRGEHSAWNDQLVYLLSASHGLQLWQGAKTNHRLNQRATETSGFNSWDTGELNLLYTTSLLNTPQSGKPSNISKGR